VYIKRNCGYSKLLVCLELASEYIYNVEDTVKLSNSCLELASEYIYNVEDKVKLSNSCLALNKN
jgi:hypothetical protein